MKNLLLILVSLTLITFTACEKENCRDNVLGTYTGTFSGGGVSNAVTLLVNEGNDEDKEVLISVQFSGITVYTVSGALNSDCTVITLPTQDINGTSTSGSLNTDGTTIKGTLVSGSSEVVIDCSK